MASVAVSSSKQTTAGTGRQPDKPTDNNQPDSGVVNQDLWEDAQQILATGTSSHLTCQKPRLCPVPEPVPLGDTHPA
ncbi:uncharacterized protein PADG_12008 [Paracoccidioides brasiliensis Pb18]|uniref:Uncharacterized protein n=2 Tax=Paracoccidioides brasiliensis TaxID=121759 RepID=A0A0A0HU73_PARBD|nr:uncharacterized protein PADG_12008 [Paracoccidioides brasiliensis Pb18]KGM91868.1 hypothetical protein PADG_12008 [Paracoccidioides brasiliensis Pb18]